MTPPKEGDLKAGLTGLIFAVVVLGTAMTAIVKFTTARYAAEKPAAGETK
jgi:hypothetical protein